MSFFFSKQTQDVLRPLGGLHVPPPLKCPQSLENWQLCTLNNHGYNSTAVTCRYHVPEHLDASQDKLKQWFEAAVAKTLIRQPLLQAGISGADTKKPVWVPFKQSLFPELIEWRAVSPQDDYDATLDALLQGEVDRRLVDTDVRPGWRLTVLRVADSDRLDAVFTWSHAYCDGMGAKIFHKTLLEELDAMTASKAASLVSDGVFKTTATAQNVPPSQELAAKYPLSLGFAASTVWKELKPTMLVTPSITNAVWAPILDGPFKTRLRNISIDAETLPKVLTACRNNDTTLTGLLQAIALLSVASQLDERQLQGAACNTAINLRRHYPVRPSPYPTFEPRDTSANYVTVLEHHIDEPTVSKARGLVASTSSSAAWEKSPEVLSGLWEFAGTARREIQERLDLGLKDEQAGLLFLVGDMPDYVQALTKKPRPTSWEVSNIGVINPKPRRSKSESEIGGWAIEEARFSLSGVSSGPAVSIAPVAVRGGRLNIGIAWPQEEVADSLGDQVTSDIERCLKHISSTGDSHS